MTEPPSGTVTFLFTDIEGSTRLWEEQPEQAARLVAGHDQVMQTTIEIHTGRVFSTAGDSFAAAFSTPANAVQAAIDAQFALRDLLPVRMAVHVGPVEARGSDYFGSTLNRCGRLRDAAHGGQIICSQAIAETLDRTIVNLLDLGEHRLKDLGRPERIHQILHPDLPAEFPPLNTLTIDKTNLPIQVTSFIGRHQEMAEIDKLLHASRLVTLTGAGGCGKSRLAMETAADLSDEYPDGVWNVELAPIDDPELVPQTVATLFGVRERPDASLTEALVTYLRRRRLLLILDNCEHLLDSVAPMAHSVLSSTPDVAILATSREPLRTHGEAIYPLAPLPLPDADAEAPAVARSDAIRLFTERATAASPDFHLTTDTALTVASICRQLDGIPLAIELAAATIRLLPLPQIEARLDERFRLLRHGTRDRLQHHRTLQAAIDWSYDHLTAAEETLFARLAVFEGGWTLEAAEAVCAGETITESDVLPMLSDLIDRSLVVPVETTDEARFRYLETVRAYALDRLDDPDQVRRSHAEYFIGFAETMAPILTSPDALDALRHYRADLDNFRAALEYLDRTGDATSYCRLLAAFARFIWIERLYTEAHHLYTRALEIAPPDLDPSLHGQLLMRAGWNAHFCGAVPVDQRTPLATDLIHQSIPLLRESGDDRHLSEALSYLIVLDDTPPSNEALQAAERSGDPYAMGRPHHYLGIASYLVGDYDTAIRHFDRANDLLHGPHLRSHALLWKSIVLLHQGQLDEAQAACDTAAETFIEIGDRGGLENTFETEAEIALHTGRPEEAIIAWEKRRELQIDLFGAADPGGEAELAHAYIEDGQPGPALHHLQAIRRATPDPSGVKPEDFLTHGYQAAAHLYLHHDDPAQAAVTLAALDTFRAAVKTLPHKPEEEHIAHLIDHTRSLIPPDEFDAAWQHGTTLTLDDIIDLALDRDGDDDSP